jgi:hypothetical protein
VPANKVKVKGTYQLSRSIQELVTSVEVTLPLKRMNQLISAMLKELQNGHKFIF